MTFKIFQSFLKFFQNFKKFKITTCFYLKIDISKTAY